MIFHMTTVFVEKEMSIWRWVEQVCKGKVQSALSNPRDWILRYSRTFPFY